MELVQDVSKFIVLSPTKLTEWLQSLKTTINSLPEPMIFRGTLGTGGTITSLPAASASTEGDVYKVITAGTYASQTAKVGDTFICAELTTSTFSWVLIPSGDEPSGTVTSVGVSGTSPISVSGSPITSSGTISISHSNSGATAGSYGDSSTQTPGYGDTFKVPYVTVNSTGHVTDISEHTVKIPANPVTGLTLDSVSDGSTRKLANYLPLSGGTMAGTISSQIVQPKTTNVYTLGGSSNRWSTIYGVAGDYTGKVTAESFSLSTDTSWTNSYRAVPFCKNADNTSLKYYKEGFEFNPNTTTLKSANYLAKGGTIKIENSSTTAGCTIQYDATEECMKFVFS